MFWLGTPARHVFWLARVLQGPYLVHDCRASVRRSAEDTREPSQAQSSVEWIAEDSSGGWYIAVAWEQDQL